MGRGLDALLSSEKLLSPESSESGTESSLKELATTDIVRGRYQPRREFDDESLSELVSSIKSQGLMQPVVVRTRAHGGYELIAGERRWRAAQMAGMSEVPALIRDVSDEQASAMGLIENIQREDLNPLEEAAALQRLKGEFDLTQQQVADAVGKSRVAVTNLLRLLNLAPAVREMLLSGSIEMGHARALLSLEPVDQERLASEVAAKGMSVRATEAMVRAHQSGGGPGKKTSTGRKDPDTLRLEREISEKIGAPVSINQAASGSGRMVIGYSSLDELEGILAHLN